MHTEFEFQGEVVERQELLNGTESVTVEAASLDRAWQVLLMAAWNLGILEYAGEGDITLEAASGAEIYGSVAHSHGRRGEGEGVDDWLIEAAFDIDGGTGEYEGISGQIGVELALRGASVQGRLQLHRGDIT